MHHVSLSHKVTNLLERYTVIRLGPPFWQIEILLLVVLVLEILRSLLGIVTEIAVVLNITTAIAEFFADIITVAATVAVIAVTELFARAGRRGCW